MHFAVFGIFHKTFDVKKMILRKEIGENKNEINEKSTILHFHQIISYFFSNTSGAFGKKWQ